MAKESKFGTFGGVYTPSVLTILGVIMYLRLPWVVGQAGLYAALAIVGVAHVISVTTGLSISSIATDKKVGAGGPYYIVSRSLGLPIGGALGLALFVGLGFSISLYIVGFSESFLNFLQGYFEFEASKNALRICGTITIALLTMLTLISTAFAIKTQYVILSLIGLSLISIFLGGRETPPAAAHLSPTPGFDMALIFGIFFPAVTGFTAGVNMSGDLRRPKQSIPTGTMLAIVTGLIVYVGLTVFLALRVDKQQLVDDPSVLENIALVPALVTAGIWGATLSSALGSILGAPRILQALAKDGIGPRFLARGHGPTNEPRNALLFSFALGEAGILIAELDVIARVVSMVFLTMYGVLNLSCAIESWASPDFRPSFRIHRGWSVLGAVACVLIMIQLDLPAMLGASALMGGLFVYLTRRQLQLESGDTWQGFWSSLVRSGLFELNTRGQHRRNWRPNLLLFATPDSSTGLSDFAASITASNGILTRFELATPTRKLPGSGKPIQRVPDLDESNQRIGVFARRLVAEDQYQAVGDLCRYYGFAGLEPNSVMLDFASYEADFERFSSLLEGLGRLNYNQLVFSERRRDSDTVDSQRIDVWWRSGAGHLALSLSLVRFITSTEALRNTSLRFLLLSADSSNNDILRTTLRRVLTEARVEADIRVVTDSLGTVSLADLVRQYSSDARLTVIGLPEEASACSADFLQRTAAMLDSLGECVLIRSSTEFEELLSVGRKASVSLLPSAGEEQEEQFDLSELVAPETPALRVIVDEQIEAYRSLLQAFHEHCVARAYSPNIELVRRLKRAVAKEYDELEKGLSKENPRRQRKAVNRVTSAFLLEANGILEQFQKNDLPEQRATLEGRVDAFLDADDVVPEDPNALIRITRARADFAPHPDDTPYLSGFKRRKRWGSWLRRGAIAYKIPIGRLCGFYFERAIKNSLDTTLMSFVIDSHQLAIHLGKLLHSSRTALSLIREDPNESDDPPAELRAQRDRTLEHFDSLIRQQKNRVREHYRALQQQTLELLQAFANDLGRLDVAALVKRERRLDPARIALREALHDLPTTWTTRQQQLFDRAALALKLSGFHYRLATVAQREKEALQVAVGEGTLNDLTRLYNSLDDLAAALRGSANRPGWSPPVELRARFDPSDALDRWTQEIESITQDLPESAQILSDETVEHLEEGHHEGLEVTSVAVRSLARFLIETELIAKLQEELEAFPHAERRAVAVAQDVARLISFQRGELDAEEGLSSASVAEQMQSVVQNGLERLKSEIEQLEAARSRLASILGSEVQVVLDSTNAYELTRSSDALEQHIRLQRGRRAVSGFRGALRRALGRVRQGLVTGLYRASTGVLLARRLRAQSSAAGNLVDRCLVLVNANSPKPAVLQALPFYYRQLFFGQSTLSETFWVGREAQLERARQALAHRTRGAYGALVIVGERASGKSALWQRIATRQLEKWKLCRVMPRPGGSPAVPDFERALAHSCGTKGRPAEILRSLTDDAVIVIDDLELWWERSEVGLQVIDLILDLIAKFGERHLFVLGVGNHAWGLLCRLRPLTDVTISEIESRPLGAEALKTIVLLRHDSTGVNFQLDGRDESSLSQFALARLFSSHFHHSGGVVGPTLQAWVTHIDKVEKNSITIRAPEAHSAEVLDELGVEREALLLEFILHKQLTLQRLRRVVGQTEVAVHRQVEGLVRMGLLSESRQHVYEINRFIHHVIVDRFKRRGLLP